LLKKELNELVRRFGDERRTVIDEAGIPTATPANHGAEEEKGEGGGVEAPILVEQRALVVALTRDGQIKAVNLDAYYTKGAGGVGSKAAGGVSTSAKGDEQLALAPVLTTNLHYLLLFTDRGKVFGLSVKNVPESTRSSKGESLRKFLQLAPSEQVVSLCAVADFAANSSYVVEFTRLGKVKKAPLSEYRAVDEKGAVDFKLAEGDAVVKALVVSEVEVGGGAGRPTATRAATPGAAGATTASSGGGFGEYFITTDQGQTLRFSDEEVRAQQGRQGQGVQAMNVPPGAKVVGAEYLLAGEEGRFLLAVLTAKGYGKKTSLAEYPTKGRATGGVVTIELIKGDKVAQALLVAGNGAGTGAGMGSSPLTEVIVSHTQRGQAGRVVIAALPTTKRANRGGPVIKLEAADMLETAFLV
jgi:DNA gyrase subunit A